MHAKIRFFPMLILAALLLTACGQSGNTPESPGEGDMAISGAFALYPLMTRWVQEYQALYPDMRFDLSAGGAGKGMTDALSGAVEIGMVSRTVSPEEVAQGAYAIPVAKDAVFPVVSSANPALEILLARGVTQAEFEQIFVSGQVTSWGQLTGTTGLNQAIHIYTRSDACGAAETWAKYLGGYAQEDLLGIGISGDPGLLDAVIKDPLGIGYNNLNYAYDMNSGLPITGAVVLPVDINGNGMADASELLETRAEAMQAVVDGTYPSPPARLLYLVTNGKPTGNVLAFIQWILRDGQAFVGLSGYIPLTADQLSAARELVK